MLERKVIIREKRGHQLSVHFYCVGLRMVTVSVAVSGVAGSPCPPVSDLLLLVVPGGKDLDISSRVSELSPVHCPGTKYLKAA